MRRLLPLSLAGLALLSSIGSATPPGGRLFEAAARVGLRPQVLEAAPVLYAYHPSAARESPLASR